MDLIGQVYGPIGGGMGGGGMGLVTAVVAGGMHAPFLLPIAIPAWLLTTYVTARGVYRHNSRNRRRELEELAEHLASVIKDLIATS